MEYMARLNSEKSMALLSSQSILREHEDLVMLLVARSNP
jgi:hypothetical protein